MAAAPFAVAAVRIADRRIEAINAAAARLLASDCDSLVGRTIDDFIGQCDVVEDAFAAGTPLSDEHFAPTVARAVDGRLTPIAIASVQVDDETLTVFLRADGDWSRTPAVALVSEERLHFALTSAGIGDWDLDLRTGRTRRSPLHDACFGYAERGPDEWTYETFLSHVHPEDRARVDAHYRSAQAGSGEYDVEFRAVWPDGSVHWLWSKGRFYFDAESKAIRVAGIQVDITDRIHMQEDMRLSAAALASTSDAVIIADARRLGMPTVYANDAFERVTGYTRQEIIGRSCAMLQGTDGQQPEIARMRSALAEGGACRVTLRNYRKDGSLFWNMLTLSPVYDEDERLTHYVGVLTDVTAIKTFERELIDRAMHDTLTGLPNARLFDERLAAAVDASGRDGSLVGVAFIDIDRLKRVNDSLGHAGGNRLIVAIAERLRNGVREADTVARYGGDEFVVVMPSLRERSDAVAVLERVHRAVTDELLVIDGVEIEPTASIGLALYPADAGTIPALIHAADAAMYAAKAAGRGNYRMFDRTIMAPAADRLTSENRLRHALAAGELFLVYQPIVDAAGGAIAGLEALLRWRDPQRGVVSPGSFVPLAEESGLIVPIGNWVMRQIGRQIRAWCDAGLTPVPVTMNVSVAQVRRADFLEVFAAAIAETGVDPHYLGVEITESIIMDNAERFLATLQAIRATGARVLIDDFGTGFSSLSYLKRLSLDTLKIDRSFVEHVTVEAPEAAICRAIVMLAHSVGLSAIAEGVETAEQAAFLRGIGCDLLQGYFFSIPVDAAEITAVLAGTRAWI